MRNFYAAKYGNAPIKIQNATRIGVDINGERFWFALHESLDMIGKRTISHWDSGMKVCDIPFLTLQAGVGESPREVARAYLKRFVQEKGEARVASVLRGAPALKLDNESSKQTGE